MTLSMASTFVPNNVYKMKQTLNQGIMTVIIDDGLKDTNVTYG